ncbi:MAG: hypothetical protein OXI80_15955 [Caldilineaceae bacterium]|nr:hypothetical protein [Caldilineaceae bacterium]MDE0339165.1 hypothetical protein [Caldilineaceae bacterium]
MTGPFRLANEVDTTGFGDTGMRLGDLDGDGELEAVFFQARDCHIPRMSAGGYRHEKQVHCVTAMKLDGDVMWQEGAPLGTGHWAMHEVAAAVSDIDGDGKQEIVYVTERDGRSYLRILEGDRGYYRKEVETGPNCVLQLCDIRGLGARRDILVSTFVNPIYIYDDDLNCLWNCHFYGGAGHSHDFHDIDGDGKEEAFIGYCCVRADGLKVWWRPDLEPHLEEMTRAPHVDHLHVHDIDDDGRPELLMVAGKDLVVLDAATGEDRWIFEGTHIQTCAVGKFLPEMEGQQLFVTERRLHGEDAHIGFRGYLVDCWGNEIWRMEKAGYGRTIRLAGAEGDVIFAECQGKKPTLIDGHGEIIQELDMPLHTYAEDRFDDGDTGVRAVFTIADTNGDGKLELLGFNRTRLWHWVQD